MVPSNNLGPDLNGKAVNETKYKDIKKILRNPTLLLLTEFSGSDYVGRNMDRKSTSAEAKYVAAARCCANIFWMKSQLTDYDIIYEKVPIFCDNTSAIAISNNPILHSRTKHIDIRYHFIRDHILKGDGELHFIFTQYQLADIFTKPLDEPTFKRLIVELEPPFTTYMKAIYKLDMLMAFKAPKPSSQTEEVPQGKKLGAKSGLRRKQSSKHTSESQTRASKSKTGQSKIGSKSNSAKDKSPNHPSPPTQVAQQAAGGPTSLGATSKEVAHPQLSSELPSKFAELSGEIKELMHNVKDIEIELPMDLKEIPTKLDFTSTIFSLTSQIKTLNSLPSLLNKVTKTLNRFANLLENASEATTKDVPSACQETASPAKGEKNTKDAETNLKDELVDLLGIHVVRQYYNKKLLFDKYCDKMLKRKKSPKNTNCKILTKKDPITLKIYREDRSGEVITNIKIFGGTLKASDNFTTESYMIDLSSSLSRDYSYEFITLRDLMLDCNFRGGGIRAIETLRTSIDNCYITHFTTTGILVQGGHETYIRNSFLGQHITAGGDPGERNFTGTAIDLQGNDNAITDVVIFSAAVGIMISGQANIITGVHCYNKAYGFGGTGIYLKVQGITQTRIVNSYFDYTGIVAEDPVQLHVSDCFFLGDAFIVLKSIRGLLDGINIVNNMFSGSNKGIDIVQLDQTSKEFNEIGDQVVIDKNSANGMNVKATVAKGVTQVNGTSWTIDFNKILLFPRRIKFVQHALITDTSNSFPNTILRNISNNQVLIESDTIVIGSASVSVDQGLSMLS
uniref:Polygalacturonase QRT3-like n=1 Tax=Tanacetum cinerariifolium TaxID=118510 RepID=A0A6L2NQI9_TANCI|nr:polygalacturonase QRT3-like [Tanacetum cinerariifolium]